jgi:hypothetical protein
VRARSLHGSSAERFSETLAKAGDEAPVRRRIREVAGCERRIDDVPRDAHQVPGFLLTDPLGIRLQGALPVDVDV